MYKQENISRWVKQAQNGNQKAQKALYDHYRVYLFGVANTYANTKVEAEDILLEGFYKIFKDLKSFNYKGDVRAWMRKVVVNCALMHIRKYRKWQYASIADEAEQIPDLKSSDFSTKHRAEAILTLIRALPEPQRIIFTLKGIEGYSYKEIAERLDMNENTLRSHYARAKQKLQKYFLQELG